MTEAKQLPASTDPHRILVIDIGGSHLKIAAHDHDTVRIPSGPAFTAGQMVKAAKKATKGWEYDVISVGYPGVVVHNRPIREPAHLGSGWVGFDYAKAFGCDLRMLNDAAMQALGNYQRGRMLFLGLGTGLGSALIVEGIIEPMELGHLPYRKDRTYDAYIGQEGLERLGRSKWEAHVHKVIALFAAALQPDDIVIGGGNASLLKKRPKQTRVSDNEKAILGGIRMWQSGFGMLAQHR